MLVASSSSFRIQLLSVLSSFGTSQHEELPEVSQSLTSFSVATLLDKWNPKHTACPYDFLAVRGKGVKHTLNCIVFCHAKFIAITFFFPTNVYICIAVFTEAKNVSCWPTECIISIHFSTHITLLDDASGHQCGVYFSLLLKNRAKLLVAKLIHSRRVSLDISELVHWTVPRPILCPWNQLKFFVCARTFKLPYHSKENVCIQMA